MKQPKEEKTSVAQGYTYLALGDSYTIGEKVEPGESFPRQVVSLLRQKGINIADPDIVAQTGWTTDELEAAIQKTRLRQRYDFVTLLIGVNNQYRGRKVADYIPGFTTLLGKAIQFAGNNPGHVIVLSIPDWGVTPFANGLDRKKIANEIDEYNATNKKIAEKFNVHYIDITLGTREAAADPSFLAADGLHPSGKEYTRWAGKVIESIAAGK